MITAPVIYLLGGAPTHQHGAGPGQGAAPHGGGPATAPACHQRAPPPAHASLVGSGHFIPKRTSTGCDLAPQIALANDRGDGPAGTTLIHWPPPKIHVSANGVP